MVEGLEYGNSEPRGRPAERYDGTEKEGFARDPSGKGTRERDYSDHAEFEEVSSETVEAFNAIMGSENNPLEPEGEEVVTDGGIDFPDYAGTGTRSPYEEASTASYMGNF